ncbi:ABC transporter permease [Pelomonas sp. SE-A7]|uniref:ABC transporter permease n=1 Tax=Pelomonas sp. SE-A7 TaxID=3054953 RepID=UPI00259CF9FE|nr:ABC transporter permease [Pelomonas sp. SE-A7]MDM4765885.1 ABC transporter permease [Pelomonas sp. SE-A7]
MNASFLSRMFWRQLQMGLRLYLREPQALFWFAGFPIAMLIVLGLVFGGPAKPQPLVWAHAADEGPDVLLLEKALSERGLKLERMEVEAAELRWRQGKLVALLEGEAGAPRLRINSYFGGQGMQVEALLQQAALAVQARRTGVEPPAPVPVDLLSPGGQREGNYVAFLLPGLLGLNLMMMGVFGATMTDVALREKGHYKRLSATPLPRWVFMGAQVVERIVVLFVGSALLLLTGYLAFGLSSRGSLVALFLLMALGATCFISLGYVLASLARNVESANGLANLVSMPLMLLSGVYFSLDAAPSWLQAAMSWLPLMPLLDAMRAVYNDGATLASQTGPLAIMGGWALLLFASATRRFQWR